MACNGAVYGLVSATGAAFRGANRGFGGLATTLRGIYEGFQRISRGVLDVLIFPVYSRDFQDFQDFSRFLKIPEISQDFSRILRFSRFPRFLRFSRFLQVPKIPQVPQIPGFVARGARRARRARSRYARGALLLRARPGRARPETLENPNKC